MRWRFPRRPHSLPACSQGALTKWPPRLPHTEETPGCSGHSQLFFTIFLYCINCRKRLPSPPSNKRMGFLQHTAKWGGKKSSLKHLPRQLLPGKHSLNKMLISIWPNSSVLTRKVVSEIQLSTKDDYFYNLNTHLNTALLTVSYQMYTKKKIPNTLPHFANTQYQ